MKNYVHNHFMITLTKPFGINVFSYGIHHNDSFLQLVIIPLSCEISTMKALSLLLNQ